MLTKLVTNKVISSKIELVSSELVYEQKNLTLFLPTAISVS
jgi:hypothetical protein